MWEKEWHSHFCWLPVEIEGKRYQFKTVQRRLKWACIINMVDYWEYKL